MLHFNFSHLAFRKTNTHSCLFWLLYINKKILILLGFSLDVRRTLLFYVLDTTKHFVWSGNVFCFILKASHSFYQLTSDGDTATLFSCSFECWPEVGYRMARIGLKGPSGFAHGPWDMRVSVPKWGATGSSKQLCGVWPPSRLVHHLRLSWAAIQKQFGFVP